MEDAIVTLLKETPLMRAETLLEKLKSEDIKTKKDLNPILYRMKGSGKLQVDDKYRWSVCDDYSNVVKYLKDHPKSNPKVISIDLEMTKAEVNAILYALQKEGVAVKVAKEDGTEPRWSLATSSSE